MRLKEAAARLKAAEIPNAMYEARLLFSHFGGVSPSMLYGADPDVENDRIEPYLLRRERHEPMAYILGEQGFYKETYFVSKDVLIPREDTEILVDDAVHRRCTGVSNRKILENLAYLDAQNAKIEVRIPYVPDYNDREIGAMAEVLRGLRNLTGVRVLAYHNYAGSKYTALGMTHPLPERLPTDGELEAARQTLESIGLRVIR